MSEPIHIISLGAGVQSSTMALMAAHGEITPMPKCAIFADTQDEPAGVYDTLDRIRRDLSFPLYQVTAGKLSEKVFSGKLIIPSMGSRGGMNHRRCTERYKIRPINKLIREMFGKVPIVMWVGISLDEVHRMKPNKLKRITNRWPLIELRKSRHDCEQWLSKHGFEKPEKSACTYCPYHSDRTWKQLLGSPERSSILRMDKFLNARGQFLHRSLKPIDTVDFSTDEDHGQQVMFGNECEGICGV